jgi:hypothetical protein
MSFHNKCSKYLSYFLKLFSVFVLSKNTVTINSYKTEIMPEKKGSVKHISIKLLMLIV